MSTYRVVRALEFSVEAGSESEAEKAVEMMVTAAPIDEGPHEDDLPDGVRVDLVDHWQLEVQPI